MSWQPPTTDEFNDWFTVEDALGSLFDVLEPWHKRRWLMERLKAGIVIAVARSGQAKSTQNQISSLVPIHPALWPKMTAHDETHFWETGGQNAIFSPTFCNTPDQASSAFSMSVLILIAFLDHPQAKCLWPPGLRRMIFNRRRYPTRCSKNGWRCSARPIRAHPKRWRETG